MKTGRSYFLSFVVALFLWCAHTPVAHADDGWDRPISGVPAFADAQSQLQVLVNIKGFHKINHFCVVATHDLSDPEAEVYWPTEGKLILWEPMDIMFALLWSRDYVDLKHDVVPSANDITLQYMVLPWTRPEVDEVITNCQKYGSKFTINKSESGWVQISAFPRFSSIKVQLQTLVDAQGQSKRNDFCVIGQKDGSYLAAYVYWITEDRLILWVPDPNDFDEPHGLVATHTATSI